jgi:uncharacterized membrane protein
MESYRFVFANSFSNTFIFFMGVLALSLALFSYLSQKRKIPLEWKLILLGLRVLAILLVLLTLMRPGLETKKKFIEKAQLFVLLDQSQSMSFVDQKRDPSRAEQVNLRFKKNKTALEQLQKHYEVQIFDIRNQLIPNEMGFQIQALGYQTPLSKLLKQFLGETTRKRTLGVLLFTDGRDTQNQDLASIGVLFDQKKVPLYPVGVGQAQKQSELTDIRALAIEAPLTTFQENTFVVHTAFSLLGCAHKKLKATLRVEDKEVEQILFTPTQDQEQKFVEFSHSLPQKGLYKISVEVQPLSLEEAEEELSSENNRIETFIEILEGAIKVVYLEGQNRSEYAFLNRAFKQAREIQIKGFLLLKKFSALQEIPQTLEDWLKYDVILIGDVPATSFTQAQLETLHQAIDQGGRGFLMIGGFDNYGAGLYQQSPLAPLLPVEVSPQDGQHEGRIQACLTPEGTQHFVLRLESDPAQSVALWKSFPPLEGHTKILKIKPTAVTLLETPEKDPLLVYYPYGYGKGRTMAFLADTTWRWSLNIQQTESGFKNFGDR